MKKHTPQKIKQKKLAELIGIHHVYLNAILRGRSRPSPDLALKIEQFTGISRMKLLYPKKRA
jgi:plasmid maintenance system antidote protein VapI